MEAIRRKYHEGDIGKISRFYSEMTKNNSESNSLKCGWECFSKHPCFPEFRPEEIGIWEDKEEIVGVVRLQSPWNGAVFIDLYNKYNDSCDELIQYAEDYFAAVNEDGTKYLYTNALSVNKNFQEALISKGYEKLSENYINAFSLENPIPEADIPEGFQIRSLDEVYNFDKLNALLWRAFKYEGAPPAFDADVKLSIKHAWLDYRRDICMVAIAPDGSFAAFCGMWLDKDCCEACLEPLATSEQYRNLGLAKACVYASLEKCRELGVKYAYVDPDESAAGFYQRVGFTAKVRKESIWRKANF